MKPSFYFKTSTRTLLVLMLLVKSSSAFGACTWTTTGSSTNWTTTAAWTVTYTAPGPSPCSNTPPTNGISSGDAVIINHTINLTSALYDIDGGGSLTINATGTFNLTGSMEWSNNSIVNMNPGSRLNISGNLANNNNSTGITINGSVTVGGNMTAGNGSAIGPVDSGTGTFNVAGTVITDGTATIFGSTANCTTPPCIFSSISGLGVEMLSFSVQCVPGHKASLGWATASEVNSSYFSILRSDDGSAWTAVGTVFAAGNSSQVIDYAWRDENTPQLEDVYYKLVQYDFDQEEKEYGPLQLICEDVENTFVSLPNPSNAEIGLMISGPNAKVSGQVSVYSTLGILMHRSELSLLPGMNAATLDISTALPAGMYFISLDVEGKDYPVIRHQVE